MFFIFSLNVKLYKNISNSLNKMFIYNKKKNNSTQRNRVSALLFFFVVVSNIGWLIMLLINQLMYIRRSTFLHFFFNFRLHQSIILSVLYKFRFNYIFSCYLWNNRMEAMLDTRNFVSNPLVKECRP